jgi:phage terminase small subunit
MKSSMNTGPKPPKGTTPEGKKLFKAILEEASMDAPGLILLNLLVESFDRYQQARTFIAKHGIAYAERNASGESKVKINPALAVERDAKAQIMRAWALLGFDQVPPGMVN